MVSLDLGSSSFFLVFFVIVVIYFSAHVRVSADSGNISGG